LKVSGLARSVYYYHVNNKEQDRFKSIKKKIKVIFLKHKGNYGYRRIHLALRNMGISLNPKTVLKLMKELDLQGKVRTKQHRSYKGEIGLVADNLVNRKFEAPKPNQVWLTDVTEFKVKGAKLYLSAVLDVFNREIIGHSISRNPNFKLVQDSFEKAFKQGYAKNQSADVQTVVHSDQGWLYQIKSFERLLTPYEMRQSMSRKGNCLDNALMEGFFGILKNECIYTTSFSSVDDAIDQVNQYIDYYNQERIKEKLDGKSPMEFRKTYELARKSA